MNKQTTDNFWKAWSDLQPTTVQLVEYRLYYTTDGKPICYTMEDLPGNYIEVDMETYLVGSYHVRVVDQKLVNIPAMSRVTKLKPSNTFGVPCDPRDICVVVDESSKHTKWSLT